MNEQYVLRHRDGRESGPHSELEIKRKLARDEISLEDQILIRGQWLTLHEFFALQGNEPSPVKPAAAPQAPKPQIVAPERKKGVVGARLLLILCLIAGVFAWAFWPKSKPNAQRAPSPVLGSSNKTENLTSFSPKAQETNSEAADPDDSENCVEGSFTESSNNGKDDVISKETQVNKDASFSPKPRSDFAISAPSRATSKNPRATNPSVLLTNNPSRENKSEPTPKPLVNPQKRDLAESRDEVNAGVGKLMNGGMGQGSTAGINSEVAARINDKAGSSKAIATSKPQSADKVDRSDKSKAPQKTDFSSKQASSEQGRQAAKQLQPNSLGDDSIDGKAELEPADKGSVSKNAQKTSPTLSKAKDVSLNQDEKTDQTASSTGSASGTEVNKSGNQNSKDALANKETAAQKEPDSALTPNGNKTANQPSQGAAKSATNGSGQPAKNELTHNEKRPQNAEGQPASQISSLGNSTATRPGASKDQTSPTPSSDREGMAASSADSKPGGENDGKKQANAGSKIPSNQPDSSPDSDSAKRKTNPKADNKKAVAKNENPQPSSGTGSGGSGTGSAANPSADSSSSGSSDPNTSDKSRKNANANTANSSGNLDQTSNAADTSPDSGTGFNSANSSQFSPQIPKNSSQSSPVSVANPSGEKESPKGKGNASPENQKSIVFLIDQSDSMRGKNAVLAQRQLEAQLSALKPSDSFYILFFHSSGYDSMPNEAPLKATRENIEAMLKWSANVRHVFGSNPRVAAQKALSLNPNTLIFISDGKFSSKISRDIADMNGATKARINTVNIGASRSEEKLRDLAEKSGGQYNFVSEP